MAKLRERTLQPIDLTKVLKGYENQWVALSRYHKEVLGSGTTLQAAKRKAQKTGKEFIFIKLSPYNSYYVPTQA